MTAGYILGSIIMMTMLGLAVGNYATSLTFRLPRGLKIANDPPYCDSCRKYLSPRDLFPFFSWLVNRARCRFCGAPIPALYAFVELACALLFNIAWFAFWPENIDRFILTLGIGVFVITLISLHVAEKKLFTLVVLLVAGFAALLRVYLDHDIFGFIVGGFFGLVLGILGWSIRNLIACRRLPLPDFAVMAGVGGLAVGKFGVIYLACTALPAMVLIWLLGLRSASLRGSEGVIAICLALMLLLLFGQDIETFWNNVYGRPGGGGLISLGESQAAPLG